MNIMANMQNNTITLNISSKVQGCLALCIILFICLSPSLSYAARLELETMPMELSDDVPAPLEQPSPVIDEYTEPLANTVEGATSTVAPSTAPTAVSGAAIKKALYLFGHVEFRAKIKNMPKWERVRNEERKRPSFEGDLNANLTPEVAANWIKLREKIKDAPLMEQAKAVNTFFNKWPYKTDKVLWRVEDYWATVREFVRKSGDCEDYAIAKYYALRSLGVPANKLRVVAVMEKIRGIGHAILVVFINDNAYVLDNLTNMVLVHSRLTHYEPKFSVNEDFRWAHVKPMKKGK